MTSSYLSHRGRRTSSSASFTNNRGRLSLPLDDSNCDSFGVRAQSSLPPLVSVNTQLSPSSSVSGTSATASASASHSGYAFPTPSQEQIIFADKSRRLLDATAATYSIIQNLRETNTGEFLVYYPSIGINSTRSQLQQSSSTMQRINRSQSFQHDVADGEFFPTTSLSTHARSPQTFMQRTHSVSVSPPLQAEDDQSNRLLTQETARAFNRQLNVLRLELRVGNLTTDLNSLEKQSVSKLLDEKLAQSMTHLEKLQERVADTSSKVLVTGDLNAGKSTLVNALMKRDILPTDQQPLTTAFCEVLDATENDGIEEVHVVAPNVRYDRSDPTTFTKMELRHLYKIVADNVEQNAILKVYAYDCRDARESLLHNGVVDIALIDSPGLNRDSIKTTALFARQDEIDVVVFVVSAENHFTLSGKEFLWNAANEKTHIFIVVNRFDQIKDKDRCKRLILEQIRQLSPATYKDANELVHFVSAGSVDLDGEDKPTPEEFVRLEESLRAFVLENRARSKLSPAKNYVQNTLADVMTISESNKDLAEKEYTRATKDLEESTPFYERLVRAKESTFEEVEQLAEDTVYSIDTLTRSRLGTAVDRLEDVAASVEFPGLFLVWQYANNIKDAMCGSFVKEIKQLEKHAKKETALCVAAIHRKGMEHLGEYTMEVDADRMFMKNKSRGFVVDIDAMDFFDFDLQERLGIMSISIGAFTMVGGKLLGYKSLVSGFCGVGSYLGFNNMKKMVLPVLSVAGLGVLVYLVTDMRFAVERKVAKKIRKQIKENGYIDKQCYRVSRASRKVLHLSGLDLANRFQKAIETQEKQCEEQRQSAETSQAALNYFTNLLAKTSELAKSVDGIDTEALRVK